MVAAAAAVVALAALVWHRGPGREEGWLGLAFVASLMWSVAHGLEVSGASAATRHAAGDFKYVGICALSPAWVMFVAAYTGRTSWLRRRAMLLLLVEPAVVIALLADRHTHDLIRHYPSATARVAAGGALFWPHGIYTYLLLWGATAALVIRLRRLSPIYRRQTTILVLSLCVPFVLNLLYNFGVAPFREVDATPFAFVATIVVLGWGVLRFRLVNLRPVARSEAFMQISDVVVTLDPAGRIVDANNAACDAFQLVPDDLLGRPLLALLPRAAPLLPPSDRPRTAEHVINARTFDLKASSITDRHGRLLATLLTARDISDRKAVEERLAHQALHDPLTGCANRTLLFERLTHALDHAQRTRRPVAVLFVDLDAFKAVNDEFGHAAGDTVLLEVGRRLSKVLRRDDTLARMGGDEFAVLVEDVVSDDEANRVAEHITTALCGPVVVGGRAITVGASVGVAVGLDVAPDDLVRRADEAMYVVKRARQRTIDVTEVKAATPRQRH